MKLPNSLQATSCKPQIPVGTVPVKAIKRFKFRMRIDGNLRGLSLKTLCAVWVVSFLCGSNPSWASEQEKLEEPIVVNGDNVEYLTESKDVTATGNVEVIYKGSKLTCKKLSVNTQTKEGVAEGNVRLDDERGIIEGEKLIYNFQTKTGIMTDSEFRANPYFGKAPRVVKSGEKEFVAFNGFATTCSYDRPHYRIGSKQINIIPEDKIQTKNDAFYLGSVPVAAWPMYNHSLKEKFMHVQLTPGNRKDWGPFMLSAWRYNLADNINGRVYLDYRSKLGIGEGAGLNYDAHALGKGDAKFYYANETPPNLPAGSAGEFERYFLRLRHNATVDERTNFVADFYKIFDKKRKFDLHADMLKDYFYREYENDVEPYTYALLHHNFQHSSLDVLAQARTNPWFDQISKLPELQYSLAQLQLGSSPFYFESVSIAGTYNKKASTIPVTNNEENVSRLDSINKVSLPRKIAFLEFTPFVGTRETLYDKDVDEKTLPIRTIFLTGSDISTKFYRIYNVTSSFLGMDILGLRHVVTPLVSYAFNHEPTIPSSDLRQIDGIDALGRSNIVSLELSNKLQTKRKNSTVDLVDARVSTPYVIKPKSGDKLGSNFSDILFECTLLPYSWLRIDSDALYAHSGNRSDPGYRRFTESNYSINFNFASERSLGIGQRYVRKGSNELTASFLWRLNPKWKFSIFQRYNFGKNETLENGWVEQQYIASRDLHCWQMDIAFSDKARTGKTVWVVFRLKAFPEMEFSFDQSYHQPKAGSQAQQP